MNILHGVPQGSVLGPLLFIIYINDIHNCILNSSTFLFADDTALLNSNEEHKIIEKQLNHDLKALHRWLSANKISLNSTKTETVLFHSNNKEPNKAFRLTLNGKRLYPTDSVKYLGIQIDNDLSFKEHMNTLAMKLRSANGALSKIRHVSNESVLLTVFHSIFSSYNRISKIQKAALRIMTFSDFTSPSQPLFEQLKLLKFADLVKLSNILLVHDILNRKSPSDISDAFNLESYSGNQMPRGKSLGLLVKPHCKSTKYGINSIIYQSILDWNEIQSHHKEIELSTISKAYLKQLTFKFYITK